MKFKNAREAYSDLTLLNTMKEEEEEAGVSYNFILANHYSLKNYMKQNNITFEKAYNTHVICKVSIFNDRQTKHLRDAVKDGLNSVPVVTEEFFYGGKSTKIVLKHQDRRSIPLLFLLVKTFAIEKEIIFHTRLTELESQQSSSSSIKKIRKQQNLMGDDIVELINADLYCKSSAFLEPLINADGSEVEWFIKDYGIDKNREMALKMYNTQFTSQQETIDSSDIVFSNSISDEDIVKLLRKNNKKQQQL